MPTLAPRTEFSVAAENPVQVPSALQAVSGLVGTAFDVAGGLTKQKPNLEQGLINGLEQANQLREQGDEQGALALERRVMTNYGVAGGDLNSGATKEIIRTYTGRAAESVGFTSEELLMQEIQNPNSELGKKYNAALLAAQGMKPDADDESQHELAMSLIAKEEANDLLIEEAKFAWSQAGRGAILDKIDNFGNIALGSLNQVAAQGGTIKLEDIQAVRAQFGVLKANIMAGRPANVPAEEWKAITDTLAAKEEQLKYLEELAGPGNLDARAMAELMRAIDASGATDFNKNIMTRLVMDEPSIFLDRGVQGQTPFNTDLGAVMTYMNENGEGLSDGDIRTATVWDNVATTGADGGPVTLEEGLKTAQAATDVMSMVSNDTLARNMDARNEWGRAAVRQLSALQGITEGGRYLEAGQLDKMFGPKWFSDMNTIQTVDPQLHAALMSRAQRVLGSQLMLVGKKFDSLAEGSVFEFNKTTGQFRINVGRLEEQIPEWAFDTLNRAVELEYGGDWVGAMEDNGSKLYGIHTRHDGFQRGAAARAWEHFAGVRGTVPEDLRQMGRTYASLTRTINRVGQGGNLYSNQVTSFQDDGQPLLKMMDQTEGAGSYSTLFGHSQRGGGQFAGVDVTAMSIGEVLAFQDPSGKYGQWVKAELGRMGHKPRVATPVGRYQYVGTTLRGLVEEMGLGKDVLFTPAVQDAIFHYHVNKLLAGKPQSEWAGILKNTWEGFKNKSNEEVVRAAAEFLGTPPPAVAYETARGDFASETAPETTAAPPARPEIEIPEAPAAVEAVDSGTVEMSDEEIETTGGEAAKQLSARLRQQVVDRLSASDKRILRSNGIDPEKLEVFQTDAEAEEALRSGEVPAGTAYILPNGELRILEAA